MRTADWHSARTKLEKLTRWRRPWSSLSSRAGSYWLPRGHAAPGPGRGGAGETRPWAAPARHYKVMEVCGGHTHSIYKYGVDDLLPANVELVHGPGCPVCVIPMGRVDDGISLAHQDGVIFTCFGDMLRVPGSTGSLLDAKAAGADVRMVYSPLDALKLARENPDREVVFYAIGFETTAPSTALTILRAAEE